MMAKICCGVPVSESEAQAASTQCEPSSSRAARRRRMEIRRFKFVTAAGSPQPDQEELLLPTENNNNNRQKKRQRVRDCDNTVGKRNLNSDGDDDGGDNGNNDERRVVIKVENGLASSASLNGKIHRHSSLTLTLSVPLLSAPLSSLDAEVLHPKFGVASVCGRRRDMEDAVAIHPSFSREYHRSSSAELHYFAVYDGHGCSHVATRCRERLHELVKEELESTDEELVLRWESAMGRSFTRMDKEVKVTNENVVVGSANCRCELQTPECDTVGSTAVVAVVTPDNIVVANCGDSRAVLCRNGKAFPLSSDHKPDRPDELNRIQAAGGRVIYWDGPRVLGVLAMSRAIGDNYLKPYVSCEPEVTITERTAEDECLILASDGLWDVVSNETACGVARMCLRGKSHAAPSPPPESNVMIGSGGADNGESSDKACCDASMLLTKLALARHSTDNVSVVVVDLRKDT